MKYVNVSQKQQSKEKNTFQYINAKLEHHEICFFSTVFNKLHLLQNFTSKLFFNLEQSAAHAGQSHASGDGKYIENMTF